MREMCVLCKRIHESQNWKYGTYKTIDGERYGWFCALWFKPQTYEFIPQRIREERKKYARDTIQPFRSGELAREFVDAYPQQVEKMVKNGSITKKEVRKAKKVWG